MSPNAPIKPQDVVNQPELDPKGASLGLAQAEQAEQSKQAEQSADTARAEQELSAPEVIDDNSNSAKLAMRDYYNNGEADADSDLIEIVRYRLEHPAPTIRVTLDKLLTL